MAMSAGYIAQEALLYMVNELPPLALKKKKY